MSKRTLSLILSALWLVPTIGWACATQSPKDSKTVPESVEQTAHQIRSILADATVKKELTRGGDTKITMLSPTTPHTYEILAGRFCLLVEMTGTKKLKPRISPEKCEPWGDDGLPAIGSYDESVREITAILDSEGFGERFDYRLFPNPYKNEVGPIVNFLVRDFGDSYHLVGQGRDESGELITYDNVGGGQYFVTVDLSANPATVWTPDEGPGGGASVGNK